MKTPIKLEDLIQKLSDKIDANHKEVIEHIVAIPMGANGPAGAPGKQGETGAQGPRGKLFS